MKLVIIESPFAAPSKRLHRDHIRYARLCMLDCIKRNESPYASHLLLPQCLNDCDPTERALGIEAGLLWGNKADLTAVYMDYGISEGMKQGIERAKQDNREVQYRWLYPHPPVKNKNERNVEL